MRVPLGNFLEIYDFTVFGYYAAAIGQACFPSDNEVSSLLLILAGRAIRERVAAA